MSNGRVTLTRRYESGETSQRSGNRKAGSRLVWRCNNKLGLDGFGRRQRVCAPQFRRAKMEIPAQVSPDFPQLPALARTSFCVRNLSQGQRIVAVSVRLSRNV